MASQVRVLCKCHMPVQSFALQVLQASGMPGNFSFATNLTSPYVSYTGNYTCELVETPGGTTTSAMQSLTVYGEHNLMIINYKYDAPAKQEH